MTAWITKLVDLREGEARPAVQAFAALFGLIAAHTILETARDALFLSKLPASRLSLVYALVAVGALIISGLSTRLALRFGRRNALVVTLMVAASGTTLLHFVALTPAALYALYTWSGLLGTILGAQFWLFASQRFTVAQGKRLFGPIAAGGVMGAVAGAAFAAAVLSVIPVRALLLAAGGIFFATAVFLATVRAPRPEGASPESRREPDEGVLELLRRYPYLRQLTAFSVLSTAALLVTDYLFKSVASHRVPPAELGVFFARTYAALNALSLVVQFALAGRVLRKLGVVPALVVLPLLLAGGGAGVFLSGGALAVTLAMKGADGALRYSLHRVAGELLWMPLPGSTRDRSKVLIDSVIARATQALVAGALLLLATLGAGTPELLALLVIALSAGWLVVALFLRGSYLDLLRQALARGTFDAPVGEGGLDLSTLEVVVEALSSRDARRVIAAMELLNDKRRTRLIPGLILYHESDEVLLRALELGVEGRRVEWLPLIERLLQHASTEVRVGAVRALGSLGDADSLRPALSDPSPAVRAHAAFCIGHFEGRASPRANPTIRALIAAEGQDGEAALIALLDAIRDHNDDRWTDLILELGGGDRPAVVAHALLTMGRIEDRRFIPLLVERIEARDHRSLVSDALVRQGRAALTALIQALRDPATPTARRRHLPGIIARFRSPESASVLADLLEEEPLGYLRYKALRGLGRLANDGIVISVDRIERALRRDLLEHLRMIVLAAALERPQEAIDDARRAHAEASLSLVLGLLEDKQRQALERAFRLLHLEHPGEDIRRAWGVVISGDGRLRAKAMEFLDTLAHSAGPPIGERAELSEMLHLAVDDLPLAERAERAEQFVARPPDSHVEIVSMLIHDPDEFVATFACYHALELGDERLAAEVAAVCLDRPHLNVATAIARPRVSRPLLEMIDGGE